MSEIPAVAPTVVWVNGAFGVGKTSTVAAIRRRRPDAIVVDPERLGWVLQHVLRLRGDYQDRRLWRTGVRLEIRLRSRLSPRRPLVVAMTLVEPDYRREHLGRLAEHGFTVAEVILDAAPETILARLDGRGDGDSWAAGQLDRCLVGLASLDEADTNGQPLRRLRLDTDRRSSDELAQAILAWLTRTDGRDQVEVMPASADTTSPPD